MDQFDLDEAHDTDNELIKKFSDHLLMCYMMMFATMSSWDSFNANELEEGGNPCVSPDVGVKNKLGNRQTIFTSNFLTKF